MSKAPDLFHEINNAVLDLQSASYQTFQRPIKALGRLLQHEDLQSINAGLTGGLDIETYLADHDYHSGMGGDGLEWPDDPEQTLGLMLLLVLKFADNPDFMIHFGHNFTSSPKFNAALAVMTGQVVIPFVRDYKTFVLSRGKKKPQLIVPNSNKIFIVHGHDEGALQSLARFLEKLNLQVIILREQPNQGRTIIEKYEQSAEEVGFAVVLMTPDDMGAAISSDGQNQRARQNVIFELGYFAGKLGRGRVCLLRKGNVEIPSDLFGVVYTDMDPAEGWKSALVKELKAAGIQFDANRMWN
ncbi:TIR domain-containing protein [Agrobacterium arsenijevicii]|uniref:CD-NTase-associated protein 12/Pycsar effector protein TIR domain-containing protein n=1 Tax=Agrobacterium arsenijevicii TaxID=1585697 RepID=A0ABR5CZP5_9HYPH|nr:hypothetical protein RP75_27170 [Agrobacterium arsenijevicii]